MADASSNKRAAPDGLSFKKNKRPRTDKSASPTTDTGDDIEVSVNTTTHTTLARNSTGNSSNELPRQSRGATMTSRYFPPASMATPTSVSSSTQPPSPPTTITPGPGAPLTPTSQGKILVPESSPIEVVSTYRPYQPYSYAPSANNASRSATRNGGQGASSQPTFTHTNSWGPPRPSAEPSNGATLSQRQLNGRPTSSSSHTPNGAENGMHRSSRLTRGGGPVNVPESPDEMDLLASPDPPAAVRPGQRRKRNHVMSSDEEDGDDSPAPSAAVAAIPPLAPPIARTVSGSSSSMSSGPSNSRIIRGNGPNLPPSSSPAPGSSSSSIEVTSGPARAPATSVPIPSNALLSSGSPAPLPTPTEPGFKIFQFSHPQALPERLIEAWNQANGNTKIAEQLLTMPRATQSYRPVASSSQQRILPGQSQDRSQETVGRIAEREEEARTKRQTDRDRAAKSAIYTKKPMSSALPSTSSPLGMPAGLAGARAHSPSSMASSSRAATSRGRSPVAGSSTGVMRKFRRGTSPSASTSRPSSRADAVVDLTVGPTSPVVHAPAPRRTRKLLMSSDEDGDEEDDDDDEEEEDEEPKQARATATQLKVLAFFNEKSPEALQELIGCTPPQAEAIIELRPFTSMYDFNERLAQGKKKPGPAGIRNNIFSEAEAIFTGYNSVDDVLQDCEDTAAGLKRAIATWGLSSTSTSATGQTKNGAQDKGKGKESLVESGDGMLNLHSVSASATRKAKDFISVQPALLAEGVKLKEYQLLGVNWLNLLYDRKLSCILADEMGLGKTVQVISFFAHLKSRGRKGPHLIVVPSSTLENWIREFQRFAPSMEVVAYYDTKEKRAERREELERTQACQNDGEGWEVLVTTYNLAQGDDMDRKFFKKIKWDACVFDEGHVLKNFQSQRYQALMKFRGRWRLLLTGTPLQNNLQELVSLMNFILPDQFAGSLDSLRAIFKTKGDSKVTLLAQERVSRAKKMMTPFVLRRRKDQVLKDLPKKTVRIEWCDMTPLQLRIYHDTMQRSRKTVLASGPTDSATTSGVSTPNGAAPTKKAKPKGKPRETKKYLENSTNVLMDLRKAASHPMLFRTLFTDAMLTDMTNNLLKEADFRKRGAVFQYVKEDMEVMTDSELQYFCGTYKSISKFKQKESCYADAGKVQTLLKLLNGYMKEGRKVLIFSQFTQILDILQVVLDQRDMRYLVLTGSTPVDTRQSLVDEFSEDENIPVFLLSTKAGGLGITLTAASVVIMFDQDFNPHNDRQAHDRAYRIGQKRDVDVVKLICKGTIEEDMLRLGETKLALDEAVAGGAGDAANGEQGEEKEKEMKMSLMTSLRNRFVQEEGAS